MYACIGHFITSDKFVTGVYTDVVFISKIGLAVFLCPASVDIFLEPLGFTPWFYLLTGLDVFVLITTVSLNRYTNNTCINNLAFLCSEAVILEELVKLGE